MKSLCIILFLFMAPVVIAQSIKVKEQNADFSVAQNVNALVVEIPYVSQDFIDSKVKKLFKGFGKHKESKKEHSALMVELKEMGKMPFNAYAKTQLTNKEEVSVSFGFDLGGAYLNSKEHPDQFKIIQKIIEEFASASVKNWVEEIFDKETKTLNSLEKDQKELAKRKENLEKEIKDFEKKIADNKEDIKKNLDDQSVKKTEIDTQKKNVENVDKRLKELR